MIARVLSLLLFLSFTHALFEDQIGILDWRQQYVGDVNFFIPEYKAKYLFLGSVENVVAAVSNKDGSIVWRQVMESGGTLKELKLCADFLISLSRKNAAVLRAWNPLSGSIIWEKSLSENHSSSATFRCFNQNSLIANDGSNLHLIRASDGKVIWTTAVAYKHLPESVNIEVLDTSDRLGIALVLGYHKPSKASSATGSSELSSVNLQLSISDAQNSVVSQVETISLENLENGHQSCITVKTIEGQSSWYLICLTKGIASQSVLRSIGLKDMANQKWHVVKIQEAMPQLLKLDDQRFVVISALGSATIYGLSATGTPEANYRLNKAKICAKATLNGKDYLFSAFQEMNRPWENFALSVYQLDSGEPALNLTPGLWTIATHHGAVEWIHPTLYVDSTGAVAFRVLIRTEDHAIQHIRQNGHQRWLREEALADIVAVEMVDLPVSESQARMEEEFGHANSNIFEMFAKRFRTQAAQLWAFLKYCATELPHLLRTASTSSSGSLTYSDGSTRSGRMNSIGTGSDAASAIDPNRVTRTHPARLRFTQSDMKPNESTEWNELERFLTRDNFNLHKMIVVATKVGKIFGLESERGRLVWEHLVPSATVLANGKLSVFQLRNTAHFPLSPIATVLLRSKTSNLPILYSFNPITGVPLHKDASHVFHMDSDILQAVLQPGPVSEASDYIRPILLLDVKSKVHVYPPEYATILATSGDANPIYIYTIENSDARITGYRVGQRMTEQNETIYEATVVWRMLLHSGRSVEFDDKMPHSVVASAARPLTEHIHSVGRVLGDRSVLYKYLNPNLVAVVTSGGDVVAQTNSIAIYLIDVVAGRILYSAVHRRCSEPVSLVHSENWVVYTYYNHKSLRHEVTVLELYEPFNQSGGPGELCASYLVPGPWQIFLRNAFPTSWFSSFAGGTSESNLVADSTDPKPRNRGFRAYFSSLYRSTDSGGICQSTGAHSIIPQVLQQSYIFSTAPTHGAAAASLTERGITAKSVVFGLQKGALIELPKSFLDPRRTLDMTQELMLAYQYGVSPVIKWGYLICSYFSFTTNHISVTDLFFTRIAPSMTYDLLKEDFDYTAIATVTLGMIVASVVTQRLAARRVVLRAWS
ncbi:ER membrane protein complex subunit 1 [Fasciola hepatica]|uniref:ER membrane protein complex subunit 1 n=1 Tax=Fasciola hepatica TaxID=6192 RepID=A0A4E0RXI8_FASHE|nr:ER membrane protein complex subunit 1 [Fasciola hepatica]